MRGIRRRTRCVANHSIVEICVYSVLKADLIVIFMHMPVVVWVVIGIQALFSLVDLDPDAGQGGPQLDGIADIAIGQAKSLPVAVN